MSIITLQDKSESDRADENNSATDRLNLYHELRKCNSIEIDDLFIRHFSLNHLELMDEKEESYDPSNPCDLSLYHPDDVVLDITMYDSTGDELNYTFTVKDISNAKFDSYEMVWRIGLHRIETYTVTRRTPNQVETEDLILELDSHYNALRYSVINNEVEEQFDSLIQSYKKTEAILLKQGLTLP